VAVLVLQAFTVERRAARGAADEEAAGHLVRGGPDRVAGPLEAEHRVEDVDRDHRLVVRGVRRARRGERPDRTGLVDALVQDLALLGLLVGEHQVRIDRGVVLAVRVVDLLAREHRVHTEGTGLVRDDRHEARADLLVLDELAQQPDERHRRGDLLLAGALLDEVVDLVAGEHQRLAGGPARRQRPAQLATALPQVLDRLVLLAGVVVRRQVRVGLELLVRDRDALLVAELLEVVERELLHLVGGVAAREVRAQAVALDGLGQDDGRLAVVRGRGGVGCVHLAVVVPAALELPDLGVAHRVDERLGPRVPAEEVVADVGAVVGLVGLEVAVRRGVHQVDQRAVTVAVQQRVPLAIPR
jgi:hypothetical protein